MSLRFLSAQWAATAYVGVVSLGLNFLVARLLGPALFGGYGVAFAAGAILGIFLDGGFKTLLLRERTLASGKLSDMVPRLHGVAMGHALLVGSIMGVMALLLGPEWRGLAIATVASFLGLALTQFVSGALRGEGRFASDAAWQAGVRTFTAAAILGGLALGVETPTGIFLASAIGSVGVILLFPHGQTRRPRLEWHPEAYRAAIFLLWIDLATVVYFRSDMLLLNNMGVPAREIGQYVAAYRFIEAMILLAMPVGLLVFRQLRLEWQDSQNLSRRIWRALFIASLVGFASTGLLIFVAEWAISLAYGAAYREATSLLVVLAYSLLFILPNTVLTQAAIALNLERAYAVIATFAALLNVGLNGWLIPRYGVNAAAWVTVATEGWLFVALMSYLFFRQWTPGRPNRVSATVP